jgi:hypothetical protein
MKLSLIAASLLSALALTEAATAQICEEKYSGLFSLIDFFINYFD